MRYTLNNGVDILIDAQDLPLVKKFNWQTNNGYVFVDKQINHVRKRYYLHREIMNAPNDMVVDHINGNPLDNRRPNLRICTASDNARNRRKPSNGKLSKYKGVQPRMGKYEASIGRGDSYVYIGTFETEVEAAIAYNQKAIEVFGEFARLNAIPERYSDVKPKPIQHSSTYRGVMFHKRIGKWQVSIQHNKRRKHLGYFDCEKEAAEVYNEYAKKIHGSRAKLNIIN